MKGIKSVVVFAFDGMITQEKIHKLLLFLGGGGRGVNCQSPQTSCYLQNKVKEYTLA